MAIASFAYTWWTRADPDLPNLVVTFVEVTPDKVKVEVHNKGDTVKIRKIYLDAWGLDKNRHRVSLSGFWNTDQDLKPNADHKFRFEPKDVFEKRFPVLFWPILVPGMDKFDTDAAEGIWRFPLYPPLRRPEVETITECKVSIEIWPSDRKLVKELDAQECSYFGLFLAREFHEFKERFGIGFQLEKSKDLKPPAD